MTNRTHRRIVTATLLLGATAALAACAGTTAAEPAAPAEPGPITQTTDPTTTSNAPPAAPAIAEPTGTQRPATVAPTQRPANATRADDGCPVSAAILLKIANRTPDHVPTVALANVTCHEGWTTAGQEVAKEYHGKVQPVVFLFRYNAKAGNWSYASSGTGGICPSSMPADIQKHFPVCAG